MVRKSPSGKPWGPRLYYSNDYLGSVGVHLLAPVQNWLESLPGFIGLGAQTLTESGLKDSDLGSGWWIDLRLENKV